MGERVAAVARATAHLQRAKDATTMSVAPLTPLRAPFGASSKRSNRMTGTPTISVVIPARNEAENLKQILPRVPLWVHELIVVDGGSSDTTKEVARSGWADIKIFLRPGTEKVTRSD